MPPSFSAGDLEEPDVPLVANASAPLAHDPLVQPSWAMTRRDPAAVPLAALKGGTAALVVVACADDWANDGFHARAAANKAAWLLPLLARWREELGGNMVRINISRSKGIGERTLWRPLTPVTQWAAIKD